MTALKKLSDQHRLFCREYLIDFNGSEAAKRAGYSARTAKVIASQLIADPLIIAELSRAKAERIERTKIDADYVLMRLVEIDQMDVADILMPSGAVKPISEWPDPWRRYIASFDVMESISEDSGATLLKKIKWPDKVKNLELIGKHVAVQAFNDKLEIKNSDAVEGLTDDELNSELERRLVALKQLTV